MALERTARPLAQYLRCTRHDRITLPVRCLSLSATRRSEVETQQTTSRPPLDPLLVTTRKQERALLRQQRLIPISSRRRRAALQDTSSIPFEQLPYQCFQEARNVLQEDRQEKLEEIRVQRERIERLMEQVVVGENEEKRKEHRLGSMRRHLENLKILADINDPLVKKKFEDGQGDMNKPIYRFLADRQWRSYKRKILMQRIEQMNVIPDVFPTIDPIVATTLSFPSLTRPETKSKTIQHGEFVDSRLSESTPNLQIQPFDRGEKLVSIAVVNADVPNVAKDGFEYRCHFLACNIPISPTNTLVKFAALSQESQVVLPWLPAYAQKGAPYQRMSIFIMEQNPVERVSAGSAAPALCKPLDVAAIKEQGRYTVRENFVLRSFASKFTLKPIGVDLFRTIWDEGTAGVMQRADIVGWDVEFKRKRIDPLPYQRLKEVRFR